MYYFSFDGDFRHEQNERIAYEKIVHFIITSSLPEQNGRHFADGIFKWMFMNERFCILIRISLKFLARGPIDNNHICSDNGLAPNRRPAII